MLLLHGHPRTHATWHRVAPLLAGELTVVCPDLRGYGQSSKPPTTADHAPYSKTGHGRRLRRADAAASATTGSPWSGTTAARTSRTALALDHPDAVSHLAVLDARADR